jgi:hypothetical protein
MILFAPVLGKPVNFSMRLIYRSSHTLDEFARSKFQERRIAAGRQAAQGEFIPI